MRITCEACLKAAIIAIALSAFVAGCSAVDSSAWADTEVVFRDIVNVAEGAAPESGVETESLMYFAPEYTESDDGVRRVYKKTSIERTEVKVAGDAAIMLVNYRTIGEDSTGWRAENSHRDVPVILSRWEDGTWHVANILVPA